MRRRAGFVCAFVLLTGAASAHGAVTFQNTGVIAGWTEADPQHNGSIDAVTSPFYKDASAIQYTQRFDGAYTGRYHAETILATSQSNGQDRYYGKAVRLPASWVFHNMNDTISQFSPEAPEGPWILNWIQNDHLWIRSPNSSGGYTHHDLGAITANAWISLVIRLKLTNPGAFEVWVNGVKKLSLTSLNMTIANGSPTIRWSNGIYCTGWYTKTSLPAGEPTTRYLYQDHFRVASTYAEAEPANWPASATPTRAATATATARARATATATSAGGTWKAGVAYATGATVTYGGSTYRCLQAHTSQVGWEPPNVPALWAKQ